MCLYYSLRLYFPGLRYELYVGYDIRDVRLFLNYTRTGDYRGLGAVSMVTLAGTSPGPVTQTVLFRPDRPSRTLAFALRVVDDLGNAGSTSNVASSTNPAFKDRKDASRNP